MRLFILPFALFGFLFFTEKIQGQDKVSPELKALLALDGTADCLVFFHEKADLSAISNQHTKGEKAAMVFRQVQLTAARSQKNAIDLVQKAGNNARTMAIVNVLSIRSAGLPLIEALSQMPEVRYMAYDPWVFFDGPIQTQTVNQSSSRGLAEWGIEKIGAPAVWNLGFKGQGITVGGCDTGYDWFHPAIKNSYRGTDTLNGSAIHDYHWHDAIHQQSPLNGDPFNPCGFDAAAPCDDNSHGTHTIGTIAGYDGPDNQIGVAPEARWIGCRNMERGWGQPSTYLECLDWFLAPTDLDGQNPDPLMAPHVINNSWYCADVEGCTDLTVSATIADAVAVLRTSGVVVVVSNGNSGPDCATSDHAPAYAADAFSVGATREDDYIAAFSSRGAVEWDSSFRVKPDIVAPGVNVRSSIPGGGYANYGGTSMAGPHVAGAVALLLSAFPDLAGNVDSIEQILIQSSIPKADSTGGCSGQTGLEWPNNTYGHGRLDIAQAILPLLVHTQQPAGEQNRITAQVFWNPKSNQLHLNALELRGSAHFSLYRADGRLVFSEMLESTQGQVQYSKNLDLGLHSGVYFWYLRDASSAQASGRFVR